MLRSETYIVNIIVVSMRCWSRDAGSDTQDIRDEREREYEQEHNFS